MIHSNPRGMPTPVVERLRHLDPRHLPMLEVSKLLHPDTVRHQRPAPTISLRLALSETNLHQAASEINSTGLQVYIRHQAASRKHQDRIPQKPLVLAQTMGRGMIRDFWEGYSAPPIVSQAFLILLTETQ